MRAADSRTPWIREGEKDETLDLPSALGQIVTDFLGMPPDEKAAEEKKQEGYF